MSPTWNPLDLPPHELAALRDAGRINDAGRTPAPVRLEPVTPDHPRCDCGEAIHRNGLCRICFDMHETWGSGT